MHNIPLFRRRKLGRENEKGQILIEGLFVMIFITGLLIVLIGFLKRQNEVFKKYEIPAKIRYQTR